MDTIQCAVVLAKLERFDAELAARAEIGGELERMSGHEDSGWHAVVLREDRTSAWAQLTVLAKDRDALVLRLNEAGVPTALHYPVPLGEQEAYREYRAALECLNSSSVAAQCLSMPFDRRSLDALP